MHFRMTNGAQNRCRLDPVLAIVALLLLTVNESYAQTLEPSCAIGADPNRYLLPPKGTGSGCDSLTDLYTCNATYTFCLTIHSDNCTYLVDQCLTQYIDCLSEGLLKDRDGSLCSWAMMTKFAVLGAASLPSNDPAALNASSTTESCKAMACQLAIWDSCPTSGTLWKSTVANSCVRAPWRWSATHSHTITPKNDRRVATGTMTLDRPRRMRTKTRTFPTIPPDTAAPPTPRPSFTYAAAIKELNASLNLTMIQLRTRVAGIHVITPLLAGCPSFLLAFTFVNSFTSTYNALLAAVNQTLPLNVLLASTEAATQVSLQEALVIQLQLTMSYDVDAERALNYTRQVAGVWYLVNSIDTSYGFCLLTPAPPTTGRPPTPVPPTTFAPPTPIPPPNTTEVPVTTGVPLTLAPYLLSNQTLPPTQQLIFRAKLRNTLTDPFDLETFRVSLLALMGIPSEQLNLTLISTSFTVGTAVDVEFQFYGPNVAQLQSSMLGMNTAQLRSVGILDLQSAPLEVTTEAPSFIARNRSLLWVAGAGFIGFVLLFGIGIYCIVDRRRRRRLLEAEMLDEQPMLQAPSQHSV